MPTTPQHLPKKINRENLQSLCVSYDKKQNTLNKSDLFFLLAPLNSVSDLVALQYALVADFFKRFSHSDFVLVSNPLLNHIHSSNRDIIRKNRQSSISTIQELLEKLSISPSELLHTVDVSSIQGVHTITEKLFHDNQLSSRRDVCYYNIYTWTAVPDHRVLYKSVDSLRYYVRFFFWSKNDTIVAHLDDPCLLFWAVAILVHPQDKRYKKFIGKEVIIPLINKTIPIVGHDSVVQDISWTHLLIPAHSRKDFYIALELWLPYDIYAVDKNGYFTESAKEFKGKYIDDFRSNIIQFIDDIANLEKKEQRQILVPTDALTGDVLLPLLQKNVYLSLVDWSLNDWSLVTNSSYYGITEWLQDDIEKEEQWCVSSYDLTQPYMPSLLDDWEDSLDLLSSLWYRLLRDLYLLWAVSFPAKGEDIVNALLIQLHNNPLWESLLEYYRTLSYDQKDIAALQNLLLSFVKDTDQSYEQSIDALLSLLDSVTGICYTVKWYVIKYSSSFYYDHEYLSLAIACRAIPSKKIVALYSEQQLYWIKHSLYFYNKIYKKRIEDVWFVSLLKIQDLWIISSSLQSHPWDVVRLLFLSQTTTSENEEGGAIVYTGDYIYRFLNKRWNAVRILWWNNDSNVFNISDIDSILHYIENQKENFSDYDVWILTRVQYIWNEFLYYTKKYAFSQATKIVIDSLWYDISELSLFILKFAPSSQTQHICRIISYISCHLLYPFAPMTALGMLSHFQLRPAMDAVSQLLTSIDLQKNYKCTLMMDAITEWTSLIDTYVKNTNQNYTLFIQTNKDFWDYILKNHSFIINYLGSWQEIDLKVVNESEKLPDAVYSKDILTMKVALLVDERGSLDSIVPQIVNSISVLEWQLSYKQQLLQTMRNTLVRFRSGPQHQQSSLLQLQADSELLQKEIEQLQYQISKMKYF